MTSEIISGLIVAIILAAWQFVIWPKVRAFQGRGEHDISGVWDTFDSIDQTKEPVGEAKIDQKGRRVRMEVTRFKNRRNNTIDRKFIFRGRWQADQLTAIFYDKAAHYRAGAVVLRWTNSETPHRLVGKVTYWDRSPDSDHSNRFPNDDDTMILVYPYSLRKRRS